MLGEAKQVLHTPEGTLKENLTLTPVLDLAEELYSRLKNISIEVLVELFEIGLLDVCFFI